jgi:DNA-binding NtrC family response regulator
MSSQNILIVEDDAHLRSILARVLERRGHVARVAGTVAEAREALEADRPDVLLLDIDLPDDTGWELLRGDAADLAAATIVMSAGQPPRRRLEEFRPSCFLNKPFALDTLLDLIEQTGGAVDREYFSS